MADVAIELKSSGTSGCTPDPNPLAAASGDSLTITNNSGSSQTLSNITDGTINPTPSGDEITITDGNGGTWSGRIGSTSGSYDYNDGLADLTTRAGRINIG